MNIDLNPVVTYRDRGKNGKRKGYNGSFITKALVTSKAKMAESLCILNMCEHMGAFIVPEIFLFFSLLL